MRSMLCRFAVVLVAVVAALGCGGSSPATSEQPTALAGSTSANPAPGPSTGGLVSFFGPIEDVGPGSLTVAGRAFGVDEQTRVSFQENAVPYSQLQVGDLVLVRALLNRTGVWMAREIKLRVDSPPELKLHGRVSAIAAPDLSVENRVVRTGPQTAYLGVGEPHSLRDVQVGNLVTVTGFEETDADGTVVIQALKIRVESKI